MQFAENTLTFVPVTLHWRHNGRDGVSNHQPPHCLLNCLLRRRSKKTSKLRVTGLCAGNSPETGELPAQSPVTRKIFPFDDVIMNLTGDMSTLVHVTDRCHQQSNPLTEPVGARFTGPYAVLPYSFNSLQWRHNGRDSVSNHQPHDCLLNRLFRRRSKKTSKRRVTGLCAWNSPGTGEFPAQMASHAENVPIDDFIMHDANLT